MFRPKDEPSLELSYTLEPIWIGAYRQEDSSEIQGGFQLLDVPDEWRKTSLESILIWTNSN